MSPKGHFPRIFNAFITFIAMKNKAMRLNVSKQILLSYLTFGIVYFTLACILFLPELPKDSNVLVIILSTFAQAFFWASAIIYFGIAIAVSCIIGMIFTRNKESRKAFNTFRNVLIGTICFYTLSSIIMWVTT